MASRAKALAYLVGVGVLPAAALAQTATGATAPEAPAGSSSSGAAPSASASAPPTPYPATGYGWSPPRPRANGSKGRPRAHHAVSHEKQSAVPGFEPLADGSSRLYVQLSKPVTYATRTAPRSIIYVLQGAHVGRWNNTNPLVTVHFNTPVTEARLVPHGKDLWFVVSLRANVQPTVTMDAAKEGGAMLRIDFPKGDYLPGGSTSTSGAPVALPPPPDGESR